MMGFFICILLEGVAFGSTLALSLGTDCVCIFVAGFTIVSWIAIFTFIDAPQNFCATSTSDGAMALIVIYFFKQRRILVFGVLRDVGGQRDGNCLGVPLFSLLLYIEWSKKRSRCASQNFCATSMSEGVTIIVSPFFEWRWILAKGPATDEVRYEGRDGDQPHSR